MIQANDLAVIIPPAEYYAKTANNILSYDQQADVDHINKLCEDIEIVDQNQQDQHIMI